MKTVYDAEYLRIVESIHSNVLLPAVGNSAQVGKQTLEHPMENEQKTDRMDKAPKK